MKTPQLGGLQQEDQDANKGTSDFLNFQNDEDSDVNGESARKRRRLN